MSTMDTKAILDSACNAACVGDVLALHGALDGLFAALGDKAMEYAVRFALPAGGGSTYAAQLGTWRQACALLVAQQGDSESLLRVVEGLEILRRKKVAIQDLLSSNAFYGDSLLTQVGRTTAFVLGQHLLMSAHGQGQAQHLPGGPLAAGTIDSIPTEVEGVSVSPLAGNEGNHERLELIARHVLHLGKKIPDGPLDLARGPYLEPDFEEVWTLASLWRWVEELETALRSGYWTTRRAEDEGVVVIAPRNEVMYVHDVLGKRRETLYFESHVAAVAIFLSNQATDLPNAVAKVAASITLPDGGAAWDGTLDEEALRQACDRTLFGLSMQIAFRERMYNPLAKSLVVGSSEASVTWPVWLRAYEVLRVLSAAWVDAFQVAHPNAGGGNDCIKGLLLVKRASIIEILKTVGKLGPQDAEAACRLLTFDAKRRRLDIWGQPLLPCRDDLLLVTTTATLSANPRHLVELAVKQWSDSAFDIRGGPFESRIEAIWKSAPGARVKASLVFDADDRRVEFDVVAWWEGHIWLTEAKCLKAVLDAMDYAEAYELVAYSVEQLNRRKRIVLTQWELLRENAKELDLPEDPPEPERVHLVSALSIMNFTGLRQGEAIVTDHLSLGRFFQNGQIGAWAIGPGVAEQVGLGPRIWKGQRPTAEDLLSYLASPPQVLAALQGFSQAWNVLPRIADEEVVATSIPQFARLPEAEDADDSGTRP